MSLYKYKLPSLKDKINAEKEINKVAEEVIVNAEEFLKKKPKKEAGSKKSLKENK